MENSTRDILSIAVATEILEGRGSPHGGVFLSLAHLPYNLIDYLAEWFFPGVISANWDYGAFNFKELMEDVKKGYAFEVAPACHFFMGGIRIDENCQTSLEGLFAIGEVAGGLHGANRLSDVALTHVYVQGVIGGRSAASYAKKIKHAEVDAKQTKKLEDEVLQPLLRTNGVNPFEAKRGIQDLAWQKVGIIRTGVSLTEALTEIQRIKTETLPEICCRAKEREYNREWLEALQINNLTTLLECIAQSALERGESRGAHYRKDCPKTDNKNWLKNIVLQDKKGQMAVSQIPLVITKLTPPQEDER